MHLIFLRVKFCTGGIFQIETIRTLWGIWETPSIHIICPYAGVLLNQIYRYGRDSLTSCIVCSIKVAALFAPDPIQPPEGMASSPLPMGPIPPKTPCAATPAMVGGAPLPPPPIPGSQHMPPRDAYNVLMSPCWLTPPDMTCGKFAVAAAET